MSSINLVDSESAVTGISSAFDVGKVIPINMDMFPPDQPFEGYLSLITVHMSAISAATELTIRVCVDDTGDKMIITDTVSDIYTGVTTPTKGSVVFALNAYTKTKSTSDLFCFVKTNTGSCTIDEVNMTYFGER